jgi:hypothetical protein
MISLPDPVRFRAIENMESKDEKPCSAAKSVLRLCHNCFTEIKPGCLRECTFKQAVENLKALVEPRMLQVAAMDTVTKNNDGSLNVASRGRNSTFVKVNAATAEEMESTVRSHATFDEIKLMR